MDEIWLDAKGLAFDAALNLSYLGSPQTGSFEDSLQRNAQFLFDFVELVADNGPAMKSRRYRNFIEKIVSQ